MKPLDGITVLDLTRLLPGAVATMMLGDFGARVIKIEEPGAGDPARAMGYRSAYFFAVNRNKQSVGVDLKQQAGREIFLKLAATADIIVEGNRPGVMKRLGLDYETLRQANPRIIYCAITGYGQDGPYRDEAGHDINYIGIAGVLGLNGARGGPPLIPGVQIADLAGGSMQSVIGILLALAARERTGEGQVVDISMMDGALAMMQIPLATYFATGRMPERGNETLSGRYACYNVYETGDGRHLSLGALEPKFWAGACRVIGREDLIPLQFADGARQEECIAAVRSIFKMKTAAEWLEAFNKVDACLMPVNDAGEVINDPQVRHRGLIAEVEHPIEGTLRQIAPTVKLSATPAAIELPPPRLGEHTRRVLHGAGYSDELINQLARDGVVRLMDEDQTQ
ncbi:MAG TPA: CaiB/BaiF CoA-transferase family protein [Blastocatellia bacterium]|nr:CaiB/BaiF CoA-transferase family protein [Blastocatellia bacterium]